MCSNVDLSSRFVEFDGIKPATSGQTVPHFDQLS